MKWLPFVRAETHVTNSAQRAIKALLGVQRQSLACSSFSIQITSFFRSPHGRKKTYPRLTGINQFATYRTNQSPRPSGVRIYFANKQTPWAGVFFLPLPLPLAHFFNVTPTPSGNISSPQTFTQDGGVIRKCALARPKYACTAG